MNVSVQCNFYEPVYLYNKLEISTKYARCYEYGRKLVSVQKGQGSFVGRKERKKLIRPSSFNLRTVTIRITIYLSF